MCTHSFLKLLPNIHFLNPIDAVKFLSKKENDDGMLFYITMGDSIKEVYWNVAVKLSENIMVQDNFFNLWFSGNVIFWFY